MRSCIYCGKELAQGEECGCPSAVARRNAKQQNNSNNSDSTSENYNPYREYTTNNNTYRTGYTQKQSRFQAAREKRRAKAQARRNANAGGHGIWKDAWSFIKRYFSSPVDLVTNPGYVRPATALIISAIIGALMNLCVYFMRTGAVRTPFRLALSLLSFNPMRTYSNLLYILISIGSGAVSGILMFFIYAGIFYLTGRLVFKQRVAFWDFAPRLALAALPIAFASAVGIVFGTLSSTTLAILMVCGAIGTVVLTYEALKTEWISYSNGKIMYAMMLGYFIFVALVCYVIRLS